MAVAKERLDQLLVDRGLAESRSRAQALIRAGEVRVDGQLQDKPGLRVPLAAEIQLRAAPPYVGRGGFKLAHALDAFGLDPGGLICLDVGASTGGFVDALLQRGAARVYAVDVGTAQLAWKLRGDPRVVCMERTDIRAVEALPEPVGLATVDVAFISLTRVLPAIRPLLAADACLIALVKPQFEAGRGQVGKKGVVRDPAVRREAVRAVIAAALAGGWRLLGATPSPIQGAEGNQEFLLLLGMPAAPGEAIDGGRALEDLELRGGAAD